MAKNILSKLNKIDNEITRLGSLVEATEQQRTDEIIRLIKCAVRKFGQSVSFDAVGKDGTITHVMMTRAIPCYMENDEEYCEEGEYIPWYSAQWDWYYLCGNTLCCAHCCAGNSVYEYSEIHEEQIRKNIGYKSLNEVYTLRHLFDFDDTDLIWQKAQAYYATVLKAIEVTAECAKRGILFGQERGQWMVGHCNVYKCIGDGWVEYVDNTGIHKERKYSFGECHSFVLRANVMEQIESYLAAVAERDAEIQRIREKQERDEQEELRQRKERNNYILQCFKLANTTCPFGNYYSVRLFGKRGRYGESGDRTPMWNLDGKMERIKQFFEQYESLFTEHKIKSIDCSDFKMHDDVDDLDISIRLETECYGVRKPYGDIKIIDTDGNTHQEYIL